MTTLFFLLVLVVALLVAGSVLASLFSLFWFVVVGLVIGAIARVLVKGTGSLGLLRTMLAGIAGSIGGGLIARVLHLGDLFEFLVAIIVAALIIAVLRPDRGTDPRR